MGRVLSNGSSQPVLECSEKGRLTFCYHRFLGWPKETMLKLALNAVRGPFCLQIAN